MFRCRPLRRALSLRILGVKELTFMGTPADYTIIVLLVAISVGLWTLYDRVVQLQRDVEALKRRDEPAQPQPVTTPEQV
jgi:hypothetical protein